MQGLAGHGALVVMGALSEAQEEGFVLLLGPRGRMLGNSSGDITQRAPSPLKGVMRQACPELSS